jgi:hypothetical protein
MNNRNEYAVDPVKDYSKEAPTLVEFTLQQTAKQMKNIEHHVASWS